MDQGWGDLETLEGQAVSGRFTQIALFCSRKNE
jgi:hypothetical protein